MAVMPPTLYPSHIPSFHSSEKGNGMSSLSSPLFYSHFISGPGSYKCRTRTEPAHRSNGVVRYAEDQKVVSLVK